MGKKCDLSDFDRGIIVGARQGAFRISETADLLGFHMQQFAENGAKKKKNIQRAAVLQAEIRC